jgi:hypothetical protein
VLAGALAPHVLEVSDRFGDYGFTGLLFAVSEDADTMSIDTLLCPVASSARRRDRFPRRRRG